MFYTCIDIMHAASRWPYGSLLAIKAFYFSPNGTEDASFGTFSTMTNTWEDIASASGFRDISRSAGASGISNGGVSGRDYQGYLEVEMNGTTIDALQTLFNITDYQSLITLSSIFTDAVLPGYSSNDFVVLIFGSLIACNIDSDIYCDFGNNVENIELFTQQSDVFKVFLPNGWPAFEESEISEYSYEMDIQLDIDLITAYVDNSSTRSYCNNFESTWETPLSNFIYNYISPHADSVAVSFGYAYGC